jgi:hypothetical protein
MVNELYCGHEKSALPKGQASCQREKKVMAATSSNCGDTLIRHSHYQVEAVNALNGRA